MTSTRCSAKVYLVGAGPGDPGLITLRAAECLGRADLVLCDHLVNPDILKHASASAVLVRFGRQAGHDLSPEEIIARMIDEARKGRTVVRLKGGDPSVFGRSANETEALREAGIPFQVVPGITVGLAAGAYCEIPLTHHDDSSAVAIITGQERHDKATAPLDYGRLADFPGTLVFYMGVDSAAQWSRALIEHGKSSETPVAMVQSCTLPGQRTVRCRLGEVVDVVRREGIRPPSVFIVGKVVGRAPAKSWFASRPLFGSRVLVTGSPNISQKLNDRLSSFGADVIVQPAIRITDPPNWDPVDAAIDRLDQYDWLVFPSSNGVDYLLRRLLGRCGDVRRLGGAKLAVVGSGTAERLRTYHLQADLVPPQFNAESLAGALAGEAQGRRFLIVRADRGRQTLADELTAAGAKVDQLVAYCSMDVEEPQPEVTDALSADGIDWITVTSPATARSLVRLYGQVLRNARLASISPLTSAELTELGHKPAAEASPHTVDGVVDAIVGQAQAD